jgi:two-component system cell cycle response regulator
MRVLIAEDNTIFCRALASNIKEWGHEVFITRNGQEAWNTLNMKNFEAHSGIQIALLDWEMPKINGIELCQKIRNQESLPPQEYIYIILMTGRDHRDDILKGLNAGADDYLTKPFDHIDLKIRVENGARIVAQQAHQEADQSIDELTRLWNRTRILEFLDEEIARDSRQGQPTSVMLMEVDGFTEINEQLGYPAGDALLLELSLRLKGSVRLYDKLGHLEKDRILGVFPGCRKEHLNLLAERLHQAAVLRPARVGDKSLDISVSIGGASSEQNPNCTRQDLLDAASQALQHAKQEGGNSSIVLAAKRNQ